MGYVGGRQSDDQDDEAGSLHWRRGRQSSPAFSDALASARLDLTTRDEEGNTCLHLAPRLLAFFRPRSTLVSVFTDAGVDVDEKNERGETVLHLMAAVADADAEIETLLAAGADPNARNKAGETPLHCAASPAAIHELAAAGADCQARDQYEQTPLHRAAHRGKPETVEALPARPHREATSEPARASARDPSRQTMRGDCAW